MTTKYAAGDVLRMAIRAEEQAAAFYRRVAETQKAKRDVFLRLAEMEERHRRAFADLRRDVPDAEWTRLSDDPLEIRVRYLEYMADTYAGEGSVAATAVTGRETLEGILRQAVELEKTAILFYVSLKDHLAPDAGADKLDQIIYEEMGHLVTLTEAMKSESQAH